MRNIINKHKTKQKKTKMKMKMKMKTNIEIKRKNKRKNSKLTILILDRLIIEFLPCEFVRPTDPVKLGFFVLFPKGLVEFFCCTGGKNNLETFFSEVFN